MSNDVDLRADQTGDALPVAVWSGEIMGIKVHVLDDGRRIIDADDFAKVLMGGMPDADVMTFARAFREWMHNEEKGATQK